jgi:hypothetical protein
MVKVVEKINSDKYFNTKRIPKTYPPTCSSSKCGQRMHNKGVWEVLQRFSHTLYLLNSSVRLLPALMSLPPIPNYVKS